MVNNIFAFQIECAINARMKKIIPVITHCSEAWKPPNQNVYRYSSESKARYGLRFAQPIAQIPLQVVECEECGWWHHAPNVPPLHYDKIPIERHWALSLLFHEYLGHTEPWEACEEPCDALANRAIKILFGVK